ncbi:MAG TPA: hypothetical protein VK699_02090 [Terriglobales bacterium]|jgi:hypothetical protein|nr:hypothetical protein [Terriglobales bacterium]
MKYIFALCLTLAIAGSAFAEAGDTTVSTVPFDFVVGSTTFPAGTYSISRALNHPSTTFVIRSKDGKAVRFFHAVTSESSDPNAKIKLQFRHEGDQYFLMGVFGEADTYTIDSSRSYHRGSSLAATRQSLKSTTAAP